MHARMFHRLSQEEFQMVVAYLVCPRSLASMRAASKWIFALLQHSNVDKILLEWITLLSTRPVGSYELGLALALKASRIDSEVAEAETVRGAEHLHRIRVHTTGPDARDGIWVTLMGGLPTDVPLKDAINAVLMADHSKFDSDFENQLCGGADDDESEVAAHINVHASISQLDLTPQSAHVSADTYSCVCAILATQQVYSATVSGWRRPLDRPPPRSLTCLIASRTQGMQADNWFFQAIEVKVNGKQLASGQSTALDAGLWHGGAIAIEVHFIYTFGRFHPVPGRYTVSLLSTRRITSDPSTYTGSAVWSPHTDA